MKTIKDAVIELDGKWPEQAKDSKWFVILTKKLDGSHSELKLKRSEFESCAKRMGYINGYEWGKEYTTNGKRPELPDDLMVEVSGPFNDSFSGGIAVSRLDWSSKMFSFRVSDPRYKPVDEVSEIAESINKAEYVSEISKSKDFDTKVSETEQNNSCNERGELPPVGTVCENKISNNEWERCEIICHFKGMAVFTLGDSSVYMEDASCFRPIRTHREKVIEAAFECLKKDGFDYDATNADYFEALYNCGMLVLPGANCNTKGKPEEMN